MYIKLSKIRAKRLTKLPYTNGYYLPLPKIKSQRQYSVVQIDHMRDGRVIDSQIVLMEHKTIKSSGSFTWNVVKQQVEKLAKHSKSLEELFSKGSVMLSNDFKFVSIDIPANTTSKTAVNYAHFENEVLKELVVVSSGNISPVRCLTRGVSELTGMPLPSYLVESHECKLFGLNGTFWLQVKEGPGRKEDAYHLSGSVSNIPSRLRLVDLPQTTEHDVQYAFKGGVLEYAATPKTVKITDKDFFISANGILHLKISGCAVELGHYNPNKYFITGGVNGYITVLISRCRRHCCLWDGGEVTTPIDYLLKSGWLTNVPQNQYSLSA